MNLSEYGPKQVFVRDARPLADRISLDSHGFELRRHASSVDDFKDRDQVDRVYVPEMTSLVQKVTGADKVLPFAWMMRSASPSGGDEQPPANDVHVDHAPESVEAMARKVLAANDLPDLEFRRFVAINTWRAYSGAPQDWPLGLCDGTSITNDEGVIYPIIMVDELPAVEDIPEVLHDERSLPTAITAFQFSPDHRWYYFPDMGADEVLLFKNYDSETTGPWRVPHAGLEDTSCVPTTPRLSIEVRMLALYL